MQLPNYNNILHLNGWLCDCSVFLVIICCKESVKLLYNLQLWRHRRWFREFTVRFRPIRKEIASSMYNNICCFTVWCPVYAITLATTWFVSKCQLGAFGLIFKFKCNWYVFYFFRLMENISIGCICVCFVLTTFMFNNSLPKAKWTLVNIFRDEVDVTKYLPMLVEAMKSRLELQNDG